MYKVNVEGTKTLVDVAASTTSVKAFVFTSSASVMHDGVSDLRGIDERWPAVRPNPEYYSETKVGGRLRYICCSSFHPRYEELHD